MPLKIRRFYASILLVLFTIAAVSHAQTTDPVPVQNAAPPTSGDVMRDRISKAKAFIAVRNYNAAIFELENIRRESGDPAVRSVVNTLLMTSFVEQGDYKRAQDLLTEFFTSEQKNGASRPLNGYMAVAGQVVRSARSRSERYRALGLTVNDRALPLEAVTDLEKMRETLEMVIDQSRELGKDNAKTADAMAMMEEAVAARGALARDSFDTRRWQDKLSDTREQMANSRSTVLNAINDGTTEAPKTESVAAAPANAAAPAVTQPVSQKESNAVAAAKPAEQKPAATQNERPVVVVGKSAPETVAKKETPPPASEKSETSNEGPLEVGSLTGYATSQTRPVYPPAARTVRATGVVRVELMVDENGDVAEIQSVSGPVILQAAAKDAVRKWRFRPFTRDGQPVRATGFVSFNFAL
ncbi:MAG: energy transducer TonB [Acidobacteria bacterium]|nr:energy transducer TonB [Acidobacteriota bacterium]